MFPTTTTTTKRRKKNPTTSSSPRGYYVSSFASSKHRSFFAFREARVLRVSIFRAPSLPRGRIGRKKRACVFLYIFSPFSNGKEKEERSKTTAPQKGRALLSPFLSLAESANAAKEERGKCFCSLRRGVSLERFSLSRGVCLFPKMCFRIIRSRER